MNYVESEGNSIDEAIENALKALGAERSRVEIEILSNATRGLLGFGGKKARVRATLRKPLDATLDEPPEESVPPPREKKGRKETPRQESASVAEKPVSPAAAAASVPGPPGDSQHPQEVLEGLLQRMGFAVTVNAQDADDRVRLSIHGDSSGVLIGRYGQTLDALEYFVNRVVARGDEDSMRVVIDCESYRERRRQSLEEMAHRMADRARKRGRPVTLNPMNPRDRRIVHLALQGEADLTTKSSGKGHYRKVVIIPERERRGTPAGES